MSKDEPESRALTGIATRRLAEHEEVGIQLGLDDRRSFETSRRRFLAGLGLAGAGAGAGGAAGALLRRSVAAEHDLDGATPIAASGDASNLSSYTPADCRRADDVTVTAGSRLIKSDGKANWLTTAKIGQIILVGDDRGVGVRSEITRIDSNTQIQIAATPTANGTTVNGTTGAAWGTDAGPGLIAAFSALDGQGQGTVYVDGSFIIGTEAHIDFLLKRPNIFLLGTGSGSRLTAACPGQPAVGLVNTNSVTVRNITFMGVQKVHAQAFLVLSLPSSRFSLVEGCTFAGTTASYAVVYFHDNLGIVRDCYFGGCGAQDDGGGVILTEGWDGGLKIDNVLMLDYIGADDIVWTTTTQNNGRNPWIRVGPPRVGNGILNRGEIHVKDVYLDEAPMWCIRIASPAAADRIPSVLLENVRMNVHYGPSGGGIHVEKAAKVAMRNVWCGYRAVAPVLPGIELIDAGVVELDYVRCVQNASTIVADDLTTSLTLVDCTHTALDVACPVGHVTAGVGTVARSKAGPISDDDFPSPPRPGTLGVDTSGEHLYVRMASGWRTVALSALAATAPGAPTAVGATGGDAQATVAWARPASSGGSPITGYRVTPYIGTTGKTPVTVGNVLTTAITGLVNGTGYTFKVAAINAIGAGAESEESNLITPAAMAVTVPGAPTDVTAMGGDARATVTWTAPASDGGSAITGYRVTPRIGTTAQPPVTVGNVLTTTLTGLTNGVSYTFTVASINAVGTGSDAAPSNPVSPAAIEVPGAPTIGSATGGNAQAVAVWTAPASDGGAAITGYRVQTFRASDDAVLSTDAVGVVLTFTKTGLTNGAAVYFRVAAVSAVGTGTQSAASNVVTPAGGSSAFSDDFTGLTQGTLLAGRVTTGGTWINLVYGDFAAASGGGKVRHAGNFGGAGVVCIDAGLSDGYLQADVEFLGLNQSLCIRASSGPARNYLTFECCAGKAYLTRWAGDAYTVLAESAIGAAPSSGTHVMKVAFNGSSVTGYIDGTVILTATVSFNSTATRHGLAAGSRTGDMVSTYDNVICGR